MKRITIQNIGKYLILFVVLASSCNNKHREAIATAKSFLQAYYIDLDFKKAMQFCSDESRQAIMDQAEMIQLNPYAKDETPELTFKSLKMNASDANAASYIYTCNRVERELPLRKWNNKWIVDLKGGTVETSGNENDFMQLPSGSNGFASAVSGEIKYKKRPHQTN